MPVFPPIATLWWFLESCNQPVFCRPAVSLWQLPVYTRGSLWFSGVCSLLCLSSGAFSFSHVRLSWPISTAQVLGVLCGLVGLFVTGGVRVARGPLFVGFVVSLLLDLHILPACSNSFFVCCWASHQGFQRVLVVCEFEDLFVLHSFLK